MEPLKIATVQFETRDNDKVYNLSIIREMCRKASVEGADVVAFHECSVCGYTFAKDLSRKELLAIAEPIPTGESTQALIAIAKELASRYWPDSLSGMGIASIKRKFAWMAMA